MTSSITISREDIANIAGKDVAASMTDAEIYDIENHVVEILQEEYLTPALNEAINYIIACRPPQPEAALS